MEDMSIALAACGVASLAGAEIMKIYARGVSARAKEDRSPVTEADEAAEAIIEAWLRDTAPGVAILAEEAAARGRWEAVGEAFFLVDPLDGTKEFLQGRAEFTVNIALIRAGAPVWGVVYAPALSAMYVGVRGVGAYFADVAPGAEVAQEGLRLIACRSFPTEGLNAVTSRSHADAETAQFLDRLPIAGETSAGSSLKFCRVAEGLADVYPRFGPTMEWDTAAGHAVLEAAGGFVSRPDGTPLLYGKTHEGFRNGAFIAWGARPEALKAARFLAA